MNEFIGIYLAEVVFWTHRPIAHLLFSGAFERFPGLKFVVTEGACYWVADMKWKWDQYFGGGHTTKKMAALMKGILSKLPSEYFGENIFVGASTMSKEEIRRRHTIGCDVAMWGTDYPHPEGTWPQHDRAAAQATSATCRSATPARCSARPRRAATASTSTRCARSPSAIGPTPADLGQDPTPRHDPEEIRRGRVVEGRVPGEVGRLMAFELPGKVAVVTGGAERRRARHRRGAARRRREGRDRRHRAAGARRRPCASCPVAARSPASSPTSSDFASVESLAEAVFDRYGACHLLFNNAGVTSGGGGLPWEQEPNDWKWCFGVNVFGVANGVLAFVPRMIASGEPGVIVNTSSGDGGIAPVPYASVYAASKAAISCFTESLAHQLHDNGTNLRAAVFYPSGGLLDTGLWTAQRNRPPELARATGAHAWPGRRRSPSSASGCDRWA